MNKTLLAAAAILLSLTGCTTYYKVTDPTTDKVYYTTEIKKRDGGSQFVDARTRAEVNIQNTEVKKIGQSEYNQAVKGK